uniref:Lipase domain-containing protein n=1 Tax=Bursaphelenchus xylophilus TaxID=6326 RepID=A0A1I7SX09_BURXY
MGAFGSFGGGNHVYGQMTNKDPVVFVHGYTGSAVRFVDQMNWLKMKGYDDTTLYATTYGYWTGSGTIQPTIECRYIKTIRILIQAVHLFTNRPVNVISFSMGGAVSRKAIMGGVCVETGEDLGPPLTGIISNYIGIAGVMHGALFCDNYPFTSICNKINGMRCNNNFMIDINSKINYEGRRSFVIESTGDQVVGFQACGAHPSEFVGASIIRLDGFAHVDTYLKSFDLQYAIISGQM